MSGLEDLSREELLDVAARDRFVKEQLAARLGAMMQENLEMRAIIETLQNQLATRGASNGEVTEPADDLSQRS